MLISLNLALLLLLHLANAKSANCSVDPNAVADRRLRDTLLCNYDANVIPLNPPEMNKIRAQISLSLKHVAMNEKKGTMTITAWASTNWFDGQLAWNMSEFGGLDSVIISSKLIWTPDLTIYNSDMTQVHLNHDPVSCFLVPEAHIFCAFNLNTPIYCQADLRLWPYDVQTCMLEIGSWAYNGEQLLVEKDVRRDEHTISDKIFFENKQWTVIEIKVENVNDTFPYVSWTFKIQRHAGLFEAAFVTPAFALASCTLLSFWVISLTHRLLLCFLSLVCNVAFLISIVGQIHEYGDEKPKIAVVYRDSIVFTLVALLFCVAMPWMENSESPQILVTIADAIRERGGRRSRLLLGVDFEQDDLEQNDSTECQQQSRPKCAVFAPLLDRMVFATLFVLYTLMLLSLLP